MFTRCSHCQTVHQVSPEAIVRLWGHVHCTLCNRSFDALETLSREPLEGFAANPVPLSDEVSTDTTDVVATDNDASHIEAFVAENIHTNTPINVVNDRVDALVDVLAAHSDFIEPAEPDQQTEQASPESVTDHHHAPYIAPAPVATEDLRPESLPRVESLDPIAATPEVEIPFETEAAIDVEREILAFEFTQNENALPAADLVTEANHAAPGLQEEILAWPSETNASTNSFAPEVNELHHTLSDTASAPSIRVEAPAPSFIPANRQTNLEASSRRQWPLWLAVFGLSLLLAGQSVYVEHEALAANAKTRPWLERLCSLVSCRLPAWHEPSEMRVLARDVRPHPSVPDALMISASFRNNANWAQAWPSLELTLSDVNGQIIGYRRFEPNEYLGLNDDSQLILAGQTASITLEVRDPGKQAVAFEFEFL